MLEAEFNRQFSRLVKGGNTPIAVALSGGGDSTALLALTLRASPDRPVFAFIVDHGLREGSNIEAEAAARRAAHMGAKAKVLTWQGDKPMTAIQEKARQARYELLGQACRALGISQLLLGHTLDDQAETIWMRYEQGSDWQGLAGMAVKAKAPIWPALYGIDIIRPALRISRQELRAYCAANRLEFVDDPSNENADFLRIKARRFFKEERISIDKYLETARRQQMRRQKLNRAMSDLFGEICSLAPWGGAALTIPGEDGKPAHMYELLRVILRAISGAAYAPAQDKALDLTRRLYAPGFRGATLGGTHIRAGDKGVIISRDPGAVLGRGGGAGLPHIKLAENTPKIWDGRFLLSATQAGITVKAAGQVQNQIKRIPGGLPWTIHQTLPVFVRENTLAYDPFSGAPEAAAFSVKALTSERMNALLDGTEYL